MLRNLLRAAAAAALSTLALGAAAIPPVAAEEPGHVTHVYVNDNTAGHNTIAGFTRNADGALAEVAGSPFSTRGAGLGAITGSQGSIQPTHDGHYILAVDSGSNQVSVLRIGGDGSLTEVSGSPVWSGGIQPVSIAVHADLVYVANEGAHGVGSNYSGFRLLRSGRLVAIPGSTFALPATANPGDILFNGTGRNLVGIEVGTSDPGTFLIDSFTVGDDGRITPAAGSPFPAQSAGPFGSEFSPTNPSRLYVSNAHAGAGNGSVSAFHVGRHGSLSSIGLSPYADGQTAPCWVEITGDGRYLFTVNTASTTISSYAIQSDGSLHLLGSTPFSSGAGIRPFDARLDPSGSTLYVVDAALDAVSAFAVSGGSLTELRGSPFALPAGATPFGVAAV